jgi:hypothetical protein
LSVDVRVVGSVRCSVETVGEVLAHVAAYPEWWPATSLVAEDEAVRVRVSPLPFVEIVLEAGAVLEDEVWLEYSRGPFRGTGVWTARPDGTDERTLVSYAVHLEPVNAAVALLASTRLFRRKHESDVRRIIERLEARVRGFEPL